MYVHTHTHTHTHTHVFKCKCTYIYICLYIHTHVYIHFYTYIYIHIHIYAQIYLHISWHIHVYLHAHLYIYMSPDSMRSTRYPRRPSLHRPPPAPSRRTSLLDTGESTYFRAKFPQIYPIPRVYTHGIPLAPSWPTCLVDVGTSRYFRTKISHKSTLLTARAVHPNSCCVQTGIYIFLRQISIHKRKSLSQTARTLSRRILFVCWEHKHVWFVWQPNFEGKPQNNHLFWTWKCLQIICTYVYTCVCMCRYKYM